jgi:hypothetical protein
MYNEKTIIWYFQIIIFSVIIIILLKIIKKFGSKLLTLINEIIENANNLKNEFIFIFKSRYIRDDNNLYCYMDYNIDNDIEYNFSELLNENDDFIELNENENFQIFRNLNSYFTNKKEKIN